MITWFFGLLVLNRLGKSERWATVAQTVESQMVVPSPAPVKGVRPNRFERSGTTKVVVAFLVAAGVTLVSGVVSRAERQRPRERLGASTA